MTAYFGPPTPDWLDRTIEAFFYGPYVALALIGKPLWVKYVLFAHLAVLAYGFVRVVVFEKGGPLAGGAIVAIPIMAIALFFGAAISRFFAQLSNQHIWNRTEVSAEQPRDS